MPVLTIAAFTATMAARVTVAIVDQAIDHVTLSPASVEDMAVRKPERAVR